LTVGEKLGLLLPFSEGYFLSALDMKKELIGQFVCAMAIFLGGLLLPAHAQLGQTVEDCETAYGKPTTIDGAADSATTAYHYKFKDYSIVIYFSKRPGGLSDLPATAAKVIYQRADKAALTNDEIRSLLEANAEEQQWTPSIPGWQRSDQAVAFGEDANSKHVDSAPVALMMEKSYYESQTVQAVYVNITPELPIPSTNSVSSTNSPPVTSQ
jgi:hypothetical protein